MEEVGQQCVMRLRRDRNVAPTIAERRVLARTVLTVGRELPIVAFLWGDTHGHMAVAAGQSVAAEAARRIESALKQVLRLPVPFAPVELTPIRDVWHMKNVVRYLFTQGEHHGFDGDPLREASSFPDALGMRTVGVETARTLKAALPRMNRAGLLAMVDLVDPDCAARWDGDWLEAVAAAACRPGGRGKHRDAITARAALVRLALASFSPREIRDRLGVSGAAYRRLLEVEPAAAVVRAVRQQLVLRSPTFVRSAKEAARLAGEREPRPDDGRFLEP
jgi:hypothetical protein